MNNAWQTGNISQKKRFQTIKKIITIIIVKKMLAMQGLERAIDTLSVRRHQPHNTNQ